MNAKFLAIIFLVLGLFLLKEYALPARHDIVEFNALRQENAALKARIGGLEALPTLVQKEREAYVSAKIFSSYPFNNRNEIVINAGGDAGILVGMPVTLGGTILVGTVVRVSDGSSVVQTVFDPNWSLAVRIGRNETDGLMRGGQTPRVTMIDKEKEVREGEDIFSASELYPYGLRVGGLGKPVDSTLSTLEEAPVKFDYDLSNVRELQIIVSR